MRVIAPYLPEMEAELFLRVGENIVVLEVSLRVHTRDSPAPPSPCRTTVTAGWPGWRGEQEEWGSFPAAVSSRCSSCFWNRKTVTLL